MELFHPEEVPQRRPPSRHCRGFARDWRGHDHRSAVHRDRHAAAGGDGELRVHDSVDRDEWCGTLKRILVYLYPLGQLLKYKKNIAL